MGRFENAIRGKSRISVIAEVKRRSPSHGEFPPHAVADLIAAYERGGASAVSVVTEPTVFGGSMALLQEVRNTTKLPILRKDFITKNHEVESSARAGTNAVLLIASLMTSREIRELAATAKNLEMDAVVEIRSEEDLSKIIDIKDVIVGINNRDLATLRTDVHYAEKFISRIAPSRTIIAESAFLSAKDLLPYRLRADAVLIGTALLTAQNPQNALHSFTEQAPV